MYDIMSVNNILIIIIIGFVSFLIINRYYASEYSNTENFNVLRNYISSEEDEDNNIIYPSPSNVYDEPSRIDRYRNNFFAFNDRIYNSSHLDDPVDNLNISDNGNDFPVGMPVSEVYDILVNTGGYKSEFNQMCKNR